MSEGWFSGFGLGEGFRRLALAGLQGPRPWPLASPTVRIGVTGLSRAGKTAFLTSVAANLLARGSPRFSLAPLGAGEVPRFDHARHLAALAADPPAWPERTDAVSLLALQARIERPPFPARRLRLEFLDYPGEWLLDLPLLAQSHATWSAATLRRLEQPALAAEARDFLVFTRGLPARAPADEALVDTGTRLYRALLERLRAAGHSFLQPGRQLMPPPGAAPPWAAFFPAVGAGGLIELLDRRYQAYVEAVRRDLASPLFADMDRMVVLADLLSALHAGEAAFADMQAALGAAAGALRWRHEWAAVLGALLQLRLPPRVIGRVAFAATKADHVAERQRGNLAALTRAVAAVPEGSAQAGHFAIAAVRCTEDFVWTLEGRPVSAVRGRVLGSQVMTRSYPGEVPDRPPEPGFWGHRFLALPEFEPMRLAEAGRAGVANIGLDALLGFLLGDVL